MKNVRLWFWAFECIVVLLFEIERERERVRETLDEKCLDLTDKKEMREDEF